MQTKFLIFIAVVFCITIIFGVLIWRQTIVFEKKALAAKQRKEEYIRQLQLEEEERQRLLAEEEERQRLLAEEEKNKTEQQEAQPALEDERSQKI